MDREYHQNRPQISQAWGSGAEGTAGAGGVEVLPLHCDPKVREALRDSACHVGTLGDYLLKERMKKKLGTKNLKKKIKKRIIL